METLSSSNKTKKTNAFVAYFADYFHDFGLRQIATIILLTGAIVCLVGVCVAHEITTLVGLYLSLVAGAVGIADAICIMARVKNRRAPKFKRAIVSLTIMLVVFGIALAGILVAHVNGFYA